MEMNRRRFEESAKPPKTSLWSRKELVQKMIEVEITEDMKKRAWAKSREMGEINNSITHGDGNIAGFLRRSANQLICGDICNTYDYDIVKGDTRYDVKTKDVLQNQKVITNVPLLRLTLGKTAITMFL